MPINSIKDSLRVPVQGKIRLGVRKKSQAGNSYPSETDYFVLDDAPEVKEVYGDQPKSLDIIFPSEDLDSVAPYFYKWYAAGVKGKNGEIIGGKLQCKGDGDVADYFAQRDPTTREVPQRKCLGPECPDWTKNGVQQCKPSMNLYVVLPLVSSLGIYQLDTTSWNSIRNIVSQLEMIKQTRGHIMNLGFTLAREETPTTYVDKDGKEQTRIHYLLKLRPNETFAEKNRELLEEKRRMLSLAPWKPDEQALIEAPMEDHWEVSGSQVAIQNDDGEVTQVVNKSDLMREVAEDPDIAPLFSELCVLKKANNNAQKRLLTARKFENEEDPKAALMAYLQGQISTIKKATTEETPKKATKKKAAKKTKKAATPPTAGEDAPPPAGEVDTEGLI